MEFKTQVKNFFTNAILTLIFFLIIIPIILILLFLLPPLLILPRSIIWLLSKIFRPDLLGFVTGLNYVFAQYSSTNFPLNTMGIAVVDGHIELENLRKTIKNRVFSLKKKNGELLYKGLKTYWEIFLGYPFWKMDPTFEIKNHVRNYDYQGSLAMPPSPTEIDLKAAIGGIIVSPWPRGRSPWEMLLIHGYRGKNQTAFLIRIDHVLADGLSLYELFKVITQSEWEIPNFKISQRKFNICQLLSLGVKIPLDTLRCMFQLLPTRKLPGSDRTSSEEIVFCCSPEIPVETIKNIKNHFKISYASVLYAAAYGAIARALEKSGREVPKEFANSIVIPKPNHPGGLSIHAEIIPGRCKLRATSPEERLMEIQNSLKKLAGSTASLGLTMLGEIACVAPTQILVSLSSLFEMFNPINVATATMPVTTGPAFYEGLEVLELITANSGVINVGIMISMGGVNNKQRVSFCVNKNMFGSPEIAQNLANFFTQEIQAQINAMT